jgi:predicted DNA-binding protein (MmcQ/YjbR family)
VADILAKLREICLALPGAEETITFGHPTFRATGKAFAVLEEYKGELSIAFRVERSLQDVFLKDPRFYRTPYVGKHGWVSLRVSSRFHWSEVRELLAESHRLAVAKRAAKRAVEGKCRVTRLRGRSNRGFSRDQQLQ